MGILNVTPDSFSDGGLFFSPAQAISQGQRLAAAGADLLDIGGESTRPGAKPVSSEEECERVVPVIEALARALPLPLSIDTSKAAVAEAALQAGACMVNDVTALRGDARMAAVVAAAQADVVLMHMRGTPRTMQQRPRYRDVVSEVARFLRQAARQAVQAGIARERIWLDPGLGFGKTLAHNLQLMAELKRLTSLGFPLVLGASRKSFLGQVMNAPDPGGRLAGSLACAATAFAQGVRMVRVHDVAETVQLVRVLSAIEQQRP
jgi:dihydropteroate synthase